MAAVGHTGGVQAADAHPDPDPDPDPVNDRRADGVDPGRSVRAGRRRHRARRHPVATAALVAASLLVAAVVGANVAVARMSAEHTFERVEDVPTRPVAIVLGAGVVGDEPSPTLAQRVDAGVALLDAGRVEHLLVSGDNSRPGYDEPTVMRDRALAAGVPRQQVTRDFAGFDTYDSCARARQVFGVEAAVIVTQAYHLPRAVATCRALGIDAVGLALPDWSHRPDEVGFGYPPSLVASLQGREYLAAVKAVADVEVLRPEPTFTGPAVALGSDLAPPGQPGVPVAPA